MDLQASNLRFSFGAQHIFKTESSLRKKTIDLKLEIHTQTWIEGPKGREEKKKDKALNRYLKLS